MEQTQLLEKVIIRAVLTVKTGLHIGGSSDYAPIGAVDSVFVRDPLTKQPMIPGSSVKGKMRTLLAKTRNGGGIGNSPDNDEEVVLRLFGSAQKNHILFSRLQFSDSFVKDTSIKQFSSLDTDTYLGEVKFENTINRATGVANPRQIERYRQACSLISGWSTTWKRKQILRKTWMCSEMASVCFSWTIWVDMVPGGMDEWLSPAFL